MVEVDGVDPLSVENVLTAEEREYFNQTPTRMEVANYVNALLDSKYMPALYQYIEGVKRGAQMATMVMNTILVRKGIVTLEEMDAIKDELEKQLSDLSQKDDDQPEQAEVINEAKPIN